MRFLLPLTILSLFIATVIYLSNTFGAIFGVENRVGFYIFFTSMVFYTIGGVIRYTNSTSKTGRFTYRTAAFLMGFFLFLILSTLLVDLTSWLIAPPEHKGIIILTLTLMVCVYGIANAWNVRITQIAVPIKGLSRDIRVLHLTDTHLGHFRGAKHLEKLVAKINDQKVEAVFFTGDFLDGHIQLKAASMAPLAKIKAPVFFVEGNHDRYTGAKAIKTYLRSIGVNVLENQVALWDELQIVGLNHMLPDERYVSPHIKSTYQTIENTLPRLAIDQEKPTILLHHSPDGIEYANAAGVNLYLAGHTHGGQLFPATLFAQMMFSYNKGLHQFKETYIFVCQGTGTFGAPMRVGTKSEMAVITLKANPLVSVI